METSPMDSYIRPPNILSLSGVKASDHTDWMEERNRALYAQATIYDHGSESSQCFELPTYDEKPTAFVFSAEALFNFRTLSIDCWECCGLSDIRGDNLFIPKTPQVHSKNYVASVEGVFCSWPCAERWIETFYLAGQLQAAQENLCILFYLYTGFRVPMIRPAPPRIRHVRFGGSMTTKAYSDAIKDLNPLTEILLKNKGAVADTLQARIDRVCGNDICRLKNVHHRQSQSAAACALALANAELHEFIDQLYD